MIKSPVVTVIITNYNKKKYLFKTIKSVKGQTYKKVQIIVVDNLSNDGSEKISKKFNKVLQLQNKIRKSPALNQIHSIEIGLKKSLGEIIFLLDGDDFYKKDKLNNIIKLFLNEPNLQAVCDTPIMFPKNKRKIFSYDINRLSNSFIWPNTFPTSSITLKKKYLKDCFKLLKKNSFKSLEVDFRLCCLFPLFKNQFKIIDHNYTFYRQVDDGIMSKYQKFGVNWWIKRHQAFKFFEAINNKFNKKINYGIDYFITKILYLILK